MWVCQESGGCPPCKRVCSTAFALTPAPPATVELTTSTPGFAAVKASKSACSAFDSPGEVHHEKIKGAASTLRCLHCGKPGGRSCQYDCCRRRGCQCKSRAADTFAGRAASGLLADPHRPGINRSLCRSG